MNPSTPTSPPYCRAAGLIVGLWLAGLWALLVPTVVWADEANGCEEDRASKASVAVTLAAFDEPSVSPCDRGRHDSPSYNVCYVANPLPMSTVPHWVARQQAHEAVSLVFEEVHSLHRPAAAGTEASGRAVWEVSPPAWLDEVMADIHRSRIPHNRAAMCLESPGEQHCESLPSHAVFGSAAFLVPLMTSPDELEIPWQPEGDELTQSPLVDLRVGPSPEYRRLPDRPPPA